MRSGFRKKRPVKRGAGNDPYNMPIVHGTPGAAPARAHFHVAEPIRLPDVAGRLIDLGIDEHLAEGYVELLVHGSVKASEFARAFRTGRSEAYRLLQRLVAAKLAEMTMDRPVRFRARELDVVMDRLQADAHTRLESIALARADLAPLIATLRSQQEAPAGPTFRLVRGRLNIFDEIRRLVAAAEGSYQAIHTDTASNLAAAQTDLGALMHARAQEGVDVRILTPDDGLAETSAVAPNPCFEVRAAARPASLMVGIADGRELLALTVTDASARLHAENEMAIATTAPALVASHIALFDAWWEKARRVA